MRQRIGVLLAGILLQAGAASALTADEVVARNLSARGGAAKIAAIRSLRLAGTASFSFGDNKVEEQITETDLGGYEQVAGVWFPFSIESGEKGKPRNFRLTIAGAEPDVEVDDALFRFPTGPVGRAIVPGAAPAQSAAAPPAAPV